MLFGTTSAKENKVISSNSSLRIERVGDGVHTLGGISVLLD
jgi:hypothetical protein